MDAVTSSRASSGDIYCIARASCAAVIFDATSTIDSLCIVASGDVVAMISSEAGG
jgi:hypothetical protein